MISIQQSSEVSVILSVADIPEASVNFDRLETYTVAALQWWLLCCGITVRSSMKKAQIISKYIEYELNFMAGWHSLFSNIYRIHDVQKHQLDIVDVDGSYLYRKQQQLNSQGTGALPLNRMGGCFC